ncbi:MAG TPA: hypothetical protein VFU17_05560 [Candidatus Limnocylindrales bacterium]|nr:hypothetical protein [Candidatus Limnocylindrales bacterium]
MPDDPTLLAARLDRARRRAESSPAYSPDWDAAMALIEDLERRLADLGDTARDLTRDDAGLHPVAL